MQKGFTLIELMIVIAIIAIIAAIAIPNLLEARKGANESAAISSLRTLVTTQALFRDTDKNANTSPDYGSLAQLYAHGRLIDSQLQTGTKQGYTFTITTTDTGFSWCGYADPQTANTGTRHFFVDETGVIRYTVNAQAGVDDPAIGG